MSLHAKGGECVLEDACCNLATCEPYRAPVLLSVNIKPSW